MERPIPRSEMEVFQQVIGDALLKADPDSKLSSWVSIVRWLMFRFAFLVQFELLGSFRRGQAFSLTVELAIWHSYVSIMSQSKGR